MFQKLNETAASLLNFGSSTKLHEPEANFDKIEISQNSNKPAAKSDYIWCFKILKNLQQSMIIYYFSKLNRTSCQI